VILPLLCLAPGGTNWPRRSSHSQVDDDIVFWILGLLLLPRLFLKISQVNAAGTRRAGDIPV
jgi:hypothetical protein